MRYRYIKTKKRFDGKDTYESVILPNIVDDVNDIYITVSDNQYLDNISKKYYGDEQYWWIIAVANNISGGKISVPIGKQIKIPRNLSRILQDFENLN